MDKIVRVKSGRTCDLSFDAKIKLGCPYAKLLRKELPTKIHKDCPLEDYKNYKTEILKVICEIQDEILKHPRRPNIGKKGCLHRLQELL